MGSWGGRTRVTEVQKEIEISLVIVITKSQVIPHLISESIIVSSGLPDKSKEVLFSSKIAKKVFVSAKNPKNKKIAESSGSTCDLTPLS